MPRVTALKINSVVSSYGHTFMYCGENEAFDGNVMGLYVTQLTPEHLAEARREGVYDAQNAASWVLDGNTDRETYVETLRLLDDGDPRACDYLPATPTLSGEWAGDLTPVRLWETITGEDHASAQDRAGMAYETRVGSAIDALCYAWEEGVSETFETECERLLREAVA